MEFDDSLSTSMGDFGESTQDLEIPESLPMMAVRDVVVFNYMIIPLFVGIGPYIINYAARMNIYLICQVAIIMICCTHFPQHIC